MRALALIVLAACGGAVHRSAPPEYAALPSCIKVAVHMVELAERDNGGAVSPELADGIRNEMGYQCWRTPWSAGRRRCLTRASTLDATLACPAH